MITAGDVKNEMSKEDPKIDEFINDLLIEKFFAVMGRDSTTVDIEEARQYFVYRGYNFSLAYLTYQLKIRGFSVTRESDDRPAGSQWLRIEIPPQGD